MLQNRSAPRRDPGKEKRQGKTTCQETQVRLRKDTCLPPKPGSRQKRSTTGEKQSASGPKHAFGNVSAHPRNLLRGRKSRLSSDKQALHTCRDIISEPFSLTLRPRLSQEKNGNKQGKTACINSHTWLRAKTYPPTLKTHPLAPKSCLAIKNPHGHGKIANARPKRKFGIASSI